MSRFLLLCLAALCAGAVSGCSTFSWANFHSIYRKPNLSGRPDSLSVGVKQRVVLAKNQAHDRDVVVCAEPSPDALSVVSASLAARGEAEGYGGGDFSFASAESALNIGLRTQSIQLLRDAMYRVCEAYFNGAINRRQMLVLQKRYQNSMVGLLAIEQLTGATTPRPSVVYSSSSSDAGQGLLEAQRRVDEASVALERAKSELSLKETESQSAQSGLDTATKNLNEADPQTDELKKAKADAETKRNEANAAEQKAREDVANAQSNLDTLTGLRDAARTSAATASGGGVLPGPAEAAQMDPKTVEKVADSVKDIVELITTLDYAADDCMDFLMNLMTADSPYRQEAVADDFKADYLTSRKSIVAFCVSVLGERTAQLNVETATLLHKSNVSLQTSDESNVDQ